MSFATMTLLLLGILTPPVIAIENDSRQMERMLARSMHSVGNNRLDLALNEVDSLLKVNPNFKLAQLVKGDILLARAQPLSDFGNAPNASRDNLDDLRDEARARLQRVQQQQPITGTPKYLWQLDAQQKHVVVVDTSKSTLYVYENVNGEPRYVTDFYISVGKKGTDKVSEGDQRTPLGVYFVNAKLNREQLTDFYGPGAFPISYPNEWDKRQGRNGHGIWLHGTPSNTYSRPPRASNGCVVLSNDDFLRLGNYIEINHTPVIITGEMDLSDDADREDRQDLLDTLEQWRSDWSSLNTEAYLAHYAKDFASDKLKLEDFSRQKRLVNSGKTWIKVNLSDMSIFPYPNQPGLVVVNFKQDYSSNNLSNQINKRQYWMKRDNKWQIVYEGSA
ncbi:MAG: L,D-transpeptidase family protein [Gallionellaceae bacterium]|jgi:murein L,D-transpeptidase YafK